VERERSRRLRAGGQLHTVKPLRLPRFHPWGPDE
jgi:hypothetical protein